MKLFPIVVLVLLLSAVAAFAQTSYEYGKPEELKGLHKFYVEVGTDIDSRKRILEEIKKSKVEGLELVDSVKEAEILLIFKAVSSDIISGATTSPTFDPKVTQTNVDTQRIREGNGLVLINGKENPRLLMNFSDTQKSKFEKYPATNFAKISSRLIKKANDIK